MTYVKLLTESSRKKHLALIENLAAGTTTLCGGTLTRIPGWKRVNFLEGDECERCAALAFTPAAAKSGATAPVTCP